MIRWRRLLSLLPALATLAVLLTGNAQAVLLDVGPTVPPVVGSTPPTLGHGFPLWYRDFNRVPLELCTNEAMCLFVRPDPTQPVTFPTNMPDEVFFYSADTSVATPAGTADFISGVEGNILTTADGSLELISFARVRIRVDTNVAGTYTVTTPWKVYVFDNVPVGLRGINFTEDIGIGPNGHFEGALAGTIGPFLYCTNAPIPATDGTGGLYLGDPVTPCQVLGSTFPSAQNPTNFFRVEGPAGFGTVTTNTFTITGKIYPEVTPTPLTVDKATYALDNTGMQVNAFATTEALSNQTNPAAPFPQNFALTGALSALELTGTDVPTQAMTTNNPADGKFFSASGLFTAPATIPTEVTVTNTADSPPVAKNVPLVDEVVISEAVYTQGTRTLRVEASSADQINLPTLEVFFPNEALAAGTLSNGQTSLTFPLTLGAKTYEIPPPAVSVVSALGGSASAQVQAFIASQPPAATGVSLVASLSSPQAPNTPITFIASGTGGSGSYEYQFSVRTTDTPYAVAQAYSTSNNWTWTPTTTGPYDIKVDVRSAGSTAASEASGNVFFYQIETPATTVTIDSDLTAPQAPGTPITFTATASGGSGPFEYRFWVNTGNGYSVQQNYGTANTFVFTPTKAGIYDILVDVRGFGTTTFRDAFTTLLAYQIAPAPATAVTLTPDLASPQAPGTPITFTAVASGGTGPYEYRFWLNVGGTYVIAQDYTTTNTWTWTPFTTGNYDIMVDTRSVGSTLFREALNNVFFYQIQ